MQREARRPGIFPLAVVVVSLFSAFSLPAFADGNPSRAASPLRSLVHVEIEGDGDDARLVVVTDSPANFTSFKQLDPPRAFIDLPETRSAPTVPTSGEATDDDSDISAWRIRSFDDGAAPLTRITVDLRPGRDFAIDADGTSLTLRTVPFVARPLIALVQPSSERVASASLEPSEPPARVTPTEAIVRPAVVELPPDPEVVVANSPTPTLDLPVAVVATSPATQVERSTEAPVPEVVVASSVPTPSPEPEARSPERGSASRSIALDRLRFRRTADGARLTLRTTEPVEYSLREASPTRLVLLLEDTHIPLSTNRLPLDTRFFGTAVSRVVPRIDHAARRVSIDIELTDTTAYRAHRDDDELVVDFLPPRPDLSAELHSSGGGHP